MSYQLLAVDRQGIVALFVEGDNWFRLSMDNGWLPVSLRDEIDAHRFALTGPFEPALLEFAQLREMVAHVRNLCLESVHVPQTSFGTVADQCPPEFRIERTQQVHVPSPVPAVPSWPLPYWLPPWPSRESWIRLREAVRRYQKPASAFEARPGFASIEHRQAEEEMWTLLAEQARNICRHMRHPPILAPEDVASVALYRLSHHLARRISHPDLAESLPGILWSACRFSYVDSLRAYYRRSRYPQGNLISLEDAKEEAEGVPAEERSPFENVARSEELGALANVVWSAMEELRDRERTVIAMHYFSEMTHHEIAEILGIRDSSVRVLAARARKKLRFILSDMLPGIASRRD